ncbi:hypothetical protein C8K38_12073 [Rhodococcus sp. OK611]|uniref:hypothetical protein n=1 Tax=unclassified Rhodococcus (in: high G+C Gram-positive bacteria) TaxID=192944 RepID=UPI000BC3C67C|nr:MULTISPECIES: hypothetical protein [unclassified Rhodococcus (in: high G+C Gram-positive bacteria)]PTR37494.1 hypothetical protein C8K38_12073 [Rhodococcus sp. OK611]SNX93400.1 hypothetical protein SAMN05447004_12073 [Rhodococcus sp. OK270]
MSLPTLGRSIAISGLVLAGLFGACTPAAAGPEQDRWVNIPDTATVADGLACGGRIGGVTVATDSLPGLVYVRLNATFVGISTTPGALCSVSATLHWLNLGTGAAGSWSAEVSGGVIDFPAEPWTHLETGSGRIEVTLTTDRPHLPSVTQINVY